MFELNKDGLIEDEDVYDLELVLNDEVEGEMLMKFVCKKDDLLGSLLVVIDCNGEGIV